ncbi:MAG TPA: acyltransferase [Candidatus Binatia bacterium]|nr:acyltransferase [Candidatus Binatia bacterium]
MPTLEHIIHKLSLPLQIPLSFLARRLFRDFLYQYHVFGDPNRLTIADTAIVNNATFNLSSGTISIGDYVSFGHNVSVITGTHDIQKVGIERQKAVPTSGRDIVIRRGAWIASNATIIGPCTIGENSVIGACCLVRGDVPANTLCYLDNKVVFKSLEKNLLLS